MSRFVVSAVVESCEGLRHYLWTARAASLDEAEGDAMRALRPTGILRSLIVQPAQA